MPRKSTRADRNFGELFNLIRQARRRTEKAIRAAEARGDDQAVKDGIKLDMQLEEQMIDLVRTERAYVASTLGRSEAERALKSVVNRTRKKVRRVASIGDALKKLAEVMDLVADFAKKLA